MKILICITFFCFFLIWSILLIKEKLINADKKIYSKIKFNETKTKFFKIITRLASTPYFFIMCGILLLLLKNRKIALLISIAMIIDAGIVYIAKHIVRRERPNTKRLVEEKGYSYPSGHTFSATCFYGLCMYLIITSNINIIVSIILIISLISLIITIGISRIYLGVHYFSDVIGGFLLSTSYVCLYVYLMSDILNLL